MAKSKVTRKVYVNVPLIVEGSTKAGVLAVANAGVGQAVKLAPVNKEGGGGTLRNSIQAESISNTKAKYGSNIIYAAIQEFGGSIRVTEKMRGYLAAVKGWHLKKSTTEIKIPKQAYLIPSADWLKKNGAKAYALVLKGALRNG